MHYDGGDAALESGSMRSSVSSARSSSRDIKAAKHQLAALHLQVANLTCGLTRLVMCVGAVLNLRGVSHHGLEIRLKERNDGAPGA
jgi:hypothetical protein